MTSVGFVAIGTWWAKRPAGPNNAVASVTVMSFVFMDNFSGLEIHFTFSMSLGFQVLLIAASGGTRGVVKSSACDPMSRPVPGEF